MFKNLTFTLFSVLLLVVFMTSATTSAHAQYETKDSYYFMKDDGIFSDEEKDLEAEYIKEQCENSFLEKRYYNCACIAGTVRVERDKDQLMPQARLLNDLYNNPETPCVDTARIASEMYEFCMGYADVFRTRNEGTQNQDYCECSANTMARDFAKEPVLRMRYINRLKSSALRTCEVKFPSVILPRR